MGRRLITGEIERLAWQSPGEPEIALFAVYAAAGDRNASALRRVLQLPVSPRTWHRVFPYLPREICADGSLILWHPDPQGWQLALDRVHAGLPLNGRKSGAYLLTPGSDKITLRDFHDFDDAGLVDWSIAVPDVRFRDLCGSLHGELCRLSELVARWALQVGPIHAGQTLASRQAPALPSQRH